MEKACPRLTLTQWGGIMQDERFHMLKQSRISSALVLMGMTAAFSSAQMVTSAQSGTLHYFDGDVSIDGASLQQKAARFPVIKEQSVLRTGQGRAEVLLTPGVFLRVGENSAVKMLDTRLISTRVELLSGTVIVESDDPQMSIKDSPVALVYKDYEIRPLKHGLMEIGSDPAEMKIYKGEAAVDITSGASTNLRATVKEGRMLTFTAALLTENFNDKVGDDLYLWARDRSQSLSAANMSSARSLNSGYAGGFGSGYGYDPLYGSGSGYGYGNCCAVSANGYGLGAGNWSNGWYYNPYLDTFTFVPAYGTYWNAFGYGFFSPGTIYSYYTPPTSYWYGGGGARGAEGSIGRPLAGVANPFAAHPASLASLRPSTSGSTSEVGSRNASDAARAGSSSFAGSSFSHNAGGSSSHGFSMSAGHGGGGHR